MAVINRTELKKIYEVQGIIVLVLLLFCGSQFGHCNPTRSCDLVKKDVERKGFPTIEVLTQPVNGFICGQDTCCSTRLEHDMHTHSKFHIDKFLKDSISKLSSLIDTRAKRFDEFFRDMMNKSKLEFHDMFERTYGKIYLQNSQVFADFFSELETYYKRGTIRLSDTMDNFFNILYQRMFTVINAQYKFDETYLECVSNHMGEMKPFDDVPHKLGAQLRRSFVATRTFYKALEKGAHVAASMINLKVDDQCYKELTKMQYCGVCKGEQGSGTCFRYCESTLEHCLKNHKELNAKWGTFVDAIEKVADRLIGPYNIEIVVEPLNIKISEAIMNFQESGSKVSNKIYTICGKPSLPNRNRSKRKANYDNMSSAEDNPAFELKYDEPVVHKNKKKHKKHENKGNNEDYTQSLEKIIVDIKMKMKETKQFWELLPYQYCNNGSIAAPPSVTSQCWNGTNIPDYEDNGKQSSHVSEAIYILNQLTDNLRKAHQGQEVEMVDDTEEPLAGSGSGSGDGGEDDEDTDLQPDITVDITNGRTNNNKDINFEPPIIPEMPSSTSSTPEPEVIVVGSSASDNKMSLTRALVQYLLPIVLAWFGGAISDLL